MRGHQFQQFGEQIAVRINNSHAQAGLHIAQRQTFEQGGFAGSGLARQIDVLAPVGGRKRHDLLAAAVAVDAQRPTVTFARVRARRQLARQRALARSAHRQAGQAAAVGAGKAQRGGGLFDVSQSRPTLECKRQSRRAPGRKLQSGDVAFGEFALVRVARQARLESAARPRTVAAGPRRFLGGAAQRADGFDQSGRDRRLAPHRDVEQQRRAFQARQRLRQRRGCSLRQHCRALRQRRKIAVFVALCVFGALATGDLCAQRGGFRVVQTRRRDADLPDQRLTAQQKRAQQTAQARGVRHPRMNHRDGRISRFIL